MYLRTYVTHFSCSMLHKVLRMQHIFPRSYRFVFLFFSPPFSEMRKPFEWNSNKLCPYIYIFFFFSDAFGNPVVYNTILVIFLLQSALIEAHVSKLEVYLSFPPLRYRVLRKFGVKEKGKSDIIFTYIAERNAANSLGINFLKYLWLFPRRNVF